MTGVTWLRVAAAELTLLAAGFTALRLLAPRCRTYGLALGAGLAQLLGCLAVALELALASLAGAPWSAPLLALPWAIGLVVLHARPGAVEAPPSAPGPRETAPSWPGRAFRRLLLTGAAASAGTVFAEALLVPPFTSDGLANWSYHARRFADLGRIAFAADEVPLHPPLVPLAQAWFYVFAGRDLPAGIAKAPSPLAFAALLLLCDGVARRLGVRPALSAAGTLFLAGAPRLLATLGSLELADALAAAQSFGAAALLACDLRRPDGEPGLRRVAAALLAASALTKEQGAPLALACVAVYALALAARGKAALRARGSALLILPAGVLGARLLWRLLLSGLPSGHAAGGAMLWALPSLNAERIARTLVLLARELLDRLHWGWLWWLAAAAAGASLVAPRVRDRAGFPAAAIAAHLATIVAGYQLHNPFFDQPLELYAHDGFPRLVSHLAPLATLLILLAGEALSSPASSASGAPGGAASARDA